MPNAPSSWVTVMKAGAFLLLRGTIQPLFEVLGDEENQLQSWFCIGRLQMNEVTNRAKTLC